MDQGTGGRGGVQVRGAVAGPEAARRPAQRLT